ncbi:MAG: hypothetical protein JNL82_11370 [Myxococcales bacterium]|nr:hypothetical protein [Myxococcales bacterium]
MRRTTLLFWGSLLLGGCIQDLLADGAALAPDTETDASSTSTGEPSTPTTTGVGSGGVHTVTGDSGSTGTTEGTDAEETGVDPVSSSGEAVNLPPTVDLTVMPEHLGEAGPAELHLAVSEDVVKVRLSLDGEKIADLAPADFPYVWEALSAKDNGPARKFSAVVEDEEGLMADDDAELSVELPPAGAERCLFTAPDKGVATSMIVALRYTSEAIVAVGTSGTGTLRLTVWKLDPNNCELLPGWPRTLANWTGDPALAGLTSLGTAVDIDENGNLVVAGNFFVNGKLQSYVALLNAAGSRLWEKVGVPGDEVAGVGASKGSYSNRVFVVGSRRTSDNPVLTDGMVWVYQWTEGEEVYVQPPTVLRAPFTPDEFDSDPDNNFSEWARAVVVDPAGNALVVGERKFKDENTLVYSRAFAAQVHPFGQVLGTPWTSWAPAFKHDAVRSIGVCGDELVAAGWTLDIDPNAKPQPFLFWLESETHRHLAQLGATEIYGVACDRERKIISAATRSSGPADAQVFTVLGTSDSPTWYDQGDASADGAGAVACDHRGFCGWGGYRTDNAKFYAVVRVHHP